MPQFLEDALRKSASKKGFTGKKLAQYVYGGMNNLGAMHGNKETPRGRAMQAKHDRDMKARKKKTKLHSIINQGQ